MGDWIPVTERLPDEGQECLAYAGENSFAARTILVPIWCGGFWCASNGTEYSKLELRYWMPLPEPPEDV